MNEQEQRIAIAEACGKRIELWVEPSGTAYWVVLGPDGNLISDSAPDYLHDLNAMHSAIDTAIIPDLELTMRFQNELALVMGVESYPCETRFLWHATAAQRAEAFLRTIGKWKEDAK